MTDLADDLAEHVYYRTDVQVHDGERDVEPATMDRSQVNRLLRKATRLEDQLASVQETARAERQVITEWEDERAGIIQRQLDDIAYVTAGWMRAAEEREGIVTEKLPHGTLSLRPGSPSLICSDPAALWQWCAEERREGWVVHRNTYQPAAGDLRHYLKPGAVIGPALDKDGDPLFTDDHQALLDHDAHDPDTGERVPYVVLRLPERKRFKLTTKPRSKETRP